MTSTINTPELCVVVFVPLQLTIGHAQDDEQAVMPNVELRLTWKVDRFSSSKNNLRLYW